MIFWKVHLPSVTDQECVTCTQHLTDLLTCFKAESLGACWISRREEFWTASLSVVLLNSGCWGVKTNAGWLHNLRKYCNAFKGGKTYMQVTSHATNVCISVSFPMRFHLSRMLCSFFKNQFKYLMSSTVLLAQYFFMRAFIVTCVLFMST